MRRHLIWMAVALAALTAALPFTGAGASTRPTYPLGSATSCKAHYVEKILRHQVKRRTVQYIGCVYVAPKGPAVAAAPTMHLVGTGHASGDYALAIATGTANAPSRIELSITASPAQSATVSWVLVCTEKGGIDSVGSKTGRATLWAPGVEPVALPAPSSSCLVSADVMISAGGTVTVSIESSS